MHTFKEGDVVSYDDNEGCSFFALIGSHDVSKHLKDVDAYPHGCVPLECWRYNGGRAKGRWGGRGQCSPVGLKLENNTRGGDQFIADFAAAVLLGEVILRDAD